MDVSDEEEKEGCAKCVSSELQMKNFCLHHTKTSLFVDAQVIRLFLFHSNILYHTDAILSRLSSRVSCPGLHWSRCPGLQWFRRPGMQRVRCPGLQRFRRPGLQRIRRPGRGYGLHWFRRPGLQWFRRPCRFAAVPTVPSPKFAGVPLPRFAVVPVPGSRFAVVPLPRFAVVPLPMQVCSGFVAQVCNGSVAQSSCRFAVYETWTDPLRFCSGFIDARRLYLQTYIMEIIPQVRYYILLDFPADIGRKPALPARWSRQRLYADKSCKTHAGSPRRREPGTHTPAN